MYPIYNYHALINAIEEVIMNKKQSVKYRKQEADNIYQQVSKEENEIAQLEIELSGLKNVLANQH